MRVVMLSGRKIRDLLNCGEIAFTGTVRGDALLLTLGEHLQEFAEEPGATDPFQECSVKSAYRSARRMWDTYTLQPGCGVLISASEHLQLGANIAGIIGTLSHVARLGLFAHFASPLVSPRYQGNLCLELFNAAPHALLLRMGMPVAKVALFRTEGTDPDHGLGAVPFFYNSAPGVDVDLRSKYFEEFSQATEDHDELRNEL